MFFFWIDRNLFPIEDNATTATVHQNFSNGKEDFASNKLKA